MFILLITLISESLLVLILAISLSITLSLKPLFIKICLVFMISVSRYTLATSRLEMFVGNKHELLLVYNSPGIHLEG